MGNLKLTQDIERSIVQLRHTLHRFPELSHQEQNTKKILLGAIKKLHLKITEVPNSVGFFVDLESNSSKSFVALRADMDALPVTEKNKIDFRSKVKGKMHACGHDGHMAMVYGAMLILNKHRDYLGTGVRFIFQPAEEEATRGGAREMIEGGCLNRVSFIVGIHMWPELREGYVGYRIGPFFAGLNKFTIEIKGGKTHFARPDLASPNSIYIANQIISSLDSIINRRSYP
ncbi:MAG: amidohydrolase, partial [Candidatus Parvarchaeota archaeon]